MGGRGEFPLLPYVSQASLCRNKNHYAGKGQQQLEQSFHLQRVKLWEIICVFFLEFYETHK
jgi:hypothetical protein